MTGRRTENQQHGDRRGAGRQRADQHEAGAALSIRNVGQANPGISAESAQQRTGSHRQHQVRVVGGVQLRPR